MYKRLQKSIKKLVKPVIAGGIGALIGYFYFKLIGCRNGQCVLTGTVYRSMAYFFLIGFVTLLPFFSSKK